MIHLLHLPILLLSPFLLLFFLKYIIDFEEIESCFFILPTQSPGFPTDTQTPLSPPLLPFPFSLQRNLIPPLIISLLMESYPKASVPVGGNLQPQTGSDGFSEVLLHQYTEIDVSSEWLSSFVEECLSSAGNCHMPPKEHQTATTTITNSTLKQVKPNQKLGIPGKPRGQRKRKVTYTTTHKNALTEWSDQLKQISPSLQSAFCDPPYLLEQTYWLADSELITMPRKEEEEEEAEEKAVEKVEKENSQGQQRRCSHCQAQKTPQWRAGPSGPKTLCNACGMRYFKSGRLLPEYRPAKSPTFVNFKHSNSHKKVLQMRMTLKD